MKKLIWIAASLTVLALRIQAQANPMLCGTWSGSNITRPNGIFGKYRIPNMHFPSPVSGAEGTGPYYGSMYVTNPTHCPSTEPWYGGQLTLGQIDLTATHPLAGRKALCVLLGAGNCLKQNLTNDGGAHLADCAVTLTPLVRADCPNGLFSFYNGTVVDLEFEANRGGGSTTACINNNNTMIMLSYPNSVYMGGRFTNSNCSN